ncbi:PREDICTED: uncharacterized protein LOC105456943 [Wasmannia auropunctata]|uniref:uncharacterized protein LOC105456943 n=1 Tax=Wasmannia auropunctata TaxID=64793 RepID=UPI0005F09712|nr:PREDICTED: uncharacterized protein LOC105456943 [Wasmannia auropunctata]
MACSEFRAKTPKDRKIIVDNHRLCSNCLGNHAFSKCPSTKTCILCNAKHHLLLHDATSSSSPPAIAEASALTVSQPRKNHKAILLATLSLLHASPSTMSMAFHINDSNCNVPNPPSPFSESDELFPGQLRGKVTLQLTFTVTGATISAVAVVLPRLSLYQSTGSQQGNAWPHLQGLPLADPEFSATDTVELLLGAEVCSVIIEEGLRKGEVDAPIAQHTIFGWILSGGSSDTSLHEAASCQCSIEHELVKLVRQFWEQEEEAKPSVTLTPAEQKCEDHYASTHSRLPTGRYMVWLPLKTQPAALHETRRSAVHLLTSMERKGAQDVRFGHMYHAFLKEYEDLGHMTEVNATRLGELVCYLPHHGVLRESSSTTKLRVVFNGSQRVSTGESLNSNQYIGANLLSGLSDVLSRWRRHRFVMIADVEKMYRQILVHSNDRNFQRILWRKQQSEEVREYKLNTVTYGLASAPFLAIRTLRQLADDEHFRYPLGATVFQRDCYVDDIVTGANTIRDAIVVQTQLRELCMAGGFPLRKWAANNEELLAGIPLAHRLETTSHAWEGENHSTLGLRWFPAADSFGFKINPRKIATFTKRMALAETARLFDPLGWLAPVVDRAKFLIQSAWMQGLDWDTQLPSTDARTWHLIDELPVLEGVRIQRWVGTGDSKAKLELHGFADASERGFAAVLYLRVTATSGDISVRLLASKTRVAPLKQVSISRLELCAATILTNLVHHYQDTLEVSTAHTHLWSDSTVTLHWIREHSSRWKMYVANRVSHIQQRLPDAKWHHVPGEDNPADCASRGLSPQELLNHSLWWDGPAWLKLDQSCWPRDPGDDPAEEVLEQRVFTHVTKVDTSEPDLLLRYSALHRLLCTTAWCLRWRRNASSAPPTAGKSTSQVLTPDEIACALRTWLRVVQKLHYAKEVTALETKSPLPTCSQLLRLNPFLDAQGVLRTFKGSWSVTKSKWHNCELP